MPQKLRELPQPVLDAKTGLRGKTYANGFTNLPGDLKIDAMTQGATPRMVVTGELIRMMNYVDDIAATLRRIQAGVPTMTGEERKRLAEYMAHAEPNYVTMMNSLNKG
jgi:hypothetical protein